MARKLHLALLILAVPLAGLAWAGPEEERIPPEADSSLAKLSPAISADDLRAEVEFIASDECGGRLTGSPGALRAAQYIAAAFKRAGLRPPKGKDHFYQPFGFSAGAEMAADKCRMEILSSAGDQAAAPCKLNTGFCPLTFSGNGTAEGEVVFAGYGLVEPASGGKGYDSYAHLDVKDKIVLVLRDLPEDVTPERRQELALYAGDRYKAKLAADRGAKAFLLVTGPNSLNAGQLIKFRTGDRAAAAPILAASVSGKLAERLLAGAGADLKTLQSMLDGGESNPHANLPLKLRVRLSTELKRLEKVCRNVVGIVPPTGGCDEYVLVGAHYDHIGTGEGLGSLAKKDERGQIHNGADDNASGASTVVELAASIAGQPAAAGQAEKGAPRRGVVFACWSGEELGLVGSSHYVSHPRVPLEKTVAVFNFDMVGRLRNNKLILQAVGSSPIWRRLIERRNIPAGFSLVLQEDPYLPTDATAFYTKGIPTLAFFTDLHEDYNRPTDDPATLNYAGMERVARFAQRLIDDVCRPDAKVEYARVERSAPAPGRMGRRAYTGTVPDFAASGITGVRLSDVRPGGPADKAGLKAGDIIVEFAGQKITNLQDYSDALIGAKVGQAAPIVIEREGQRITLTITPTAQPR